jgi:hypothetical protein
VGAPLVERIPGALGSLVAAVLAALLVAALAPSAEAARPLKLTNVRGTPLSGPFAGWARAAHVPLPRGRVRVSLAGCPRRPDLVGCVVTRRPRTIHLRTDARRPRWVFLHELGHVFDLTVMGRADRRAFKRVHGRSGGPWWRGDQPAGEWFAEAYSLCARFGSATRAARATTTYSYSPSARRHRASCRVIRAAAREPRRRPGPPREAPPRLTEPPPPPAGAPPPQPPQDPDECFLMVFCN